MLSRILKIAIGALLSSLAWAATADVENISVESTKILGDYEVHYSTFNSLFIPEDIARLHGLVRAKNQTLINISVHRRDTGAAVPAQVTASARNLIQQSRNIDFKHIQEVDAVYYIGALRHRDQDVFHLDFSIVPEGVSAPLTFRVTRTLYVEP